MADMFGSPLGELAADANHQRNLAGTLALKDTLL